MRALVLEKKGQLSLRNFPLPRELGPEHVRIRVNTVGVCGSDVHCSVEPVPFDVVGMQAKEVRIETVFRYANISDRAINLIASGKIDLDPLISETFVFEDSIAAFERAVDQRPADVKIQINLPSG